MCIDKDIDVVNYNLNYRKLFVQQFVSETIICKAYGIDIPYNLSSSGDAKANIFCNILLLNNLFCDCTSWKSCLNR